MANFNPTSLEKALKLKYGQDQLRDLAYKNHPLLAMVKKDEELRGRNKEVTVKQARNGGASRTFATAQSNAKSAVLASFVVTRVKDYVVAGIDGELIEASKGDSNAFMEAVSFAIDDAIKAASHRLAISMFRDSSGYIGQVLAEPTENAGDFSITLKSEQDIVNFDYNNSIVIYSAKSGGTQRSSDGSDNEWLIEAVNRDSGVITLTGTYDSSGTIAANDYIFIEGDRGLAMSGLESWLPASAPSASESFFGVDRSVDSTRLAGIRKDISGSSIEEGLQDLAARIWREGIGKVDKCFMNPEKYNELVKELGSKVIYKNQDVTAKISFKGVMIDSPAGEIMVVSDPQCPFDKCYMLDMSTVYLGSAGAAIKLLNADGNRILRQSADDGYEVRIGGYSQLYITAPGANGVGSF